MLLYWIHMDVCVDQSCNLSDVFEHLTVRDHQLGQRSRHRVERMAGEARLIHCSGSYGGKCRTATISDKTAMRLRRAVLLQLVSAPTIWVSGYGF